MKILTRNKLSSILKWAMFCRRHPDFLWTKHDANLFNDVMESRREHIKEINNNYYKKKHVKSS